jgi:hypothetical protein
MSQSNNPRGNRESSAHSTNQETNTMIRPSNGSKVALTGEQFLQQIDLRIKEYGLTYERILQQLDTRRSHLDKGKEQRAFNKAINEVVKQQDSELRKLMIEKGFLKA